MGIEISQIRKDLQNLIEDEFPDEFLADLVWQGSTLKVVWGLVGKDSEIDGAYLERYEFSIWVNKDKLGTLPEPGKDKLSVDGANYMTLETTDDGAAVRIDLEQDIQAL